MPLVTVAGVQVNFPFEPYDCQIDYMAKVITCLREGYNGILESPTGTGKTLCLLCASLAWLEDKKAQIASQRWKLAQAEPGTGALEHYKTQLADQLDKAAGTWSGELAPPKVIYASRTHSQLSQAVQELKRTAYSHFKVCVLGSREQLCIHPQVMKEDSNTTKVHMCRSKVSTRTCHFYNNVDTAKPLFQTQIMDIEDIVKLGEKQKCCPYYMARELKTDADIIFMPYNYLLDPKSRRAHGVELQGNIVIFDEAHNLERICEESASFDLNSTDIASAIREINDISQKLQDMHANEQPGFDISSSEGGGQGMEFTLEEVLQIKAQILHLEEEIDNFPLPRPEEGVTKKGSYIFDILGKVNLSFETKPHVLDVIDKIVSYLAGESSGGLFSTKGAGLSKYADIIKIVFSRQPDERANLISHQEAVSQHYKVHIQQVNKKPYKKKADGWGAAPNAAGQKPTRTLSYWCFSPGHAMEDLVAHGVRSIILTSGTLSPISSFTAEMGIKFNIQLENPHVIEKHQVWIGIIGQGPDGTMLSSAYNNRFKDEYQSSLGNAIVNFARVVPHGLLLFFPSYPVMDKCLEHWQGSNVWNRVEQYKPIFVEPRVKAEFITAMDNFYEKINDHTANGAVFAAVCRGKVSEGLDFSDINGRAVVITGLPFPPRMDPRVMLKMQFLDDARKTGGKGLTGQQWYRQQASRAVNQAIGRVIRHKEDYGAIILCDNRFNQADAKAQLPVWIRSHVNDYSSFGLALRDMMGFFKTAQQKMPQPRTKAKRATRAGDLGCQGAYFAPTITKSISTKTGSLEKSGSIASHVPSLKFNSGRMDRAEASISKLKIQYESSERSETQSTSRKGLLDALQTHEVKGDVYVDSQIPSYQIPANSTQDKAKLKKKIVIKKSSNIERDSLQSAEQYVSEVKKTLSAESYKFFSQTLSSYKKTGDYASMVASLADVFTDNPQKYPLFRRFYRFCRPHHKQQFDQTCREVIGQGCGFKPEDALTKKRHASDSKEISSEKKMKLDKFVEPDTKTTEKCSAVQKSSDGTNKYLDSASHLNRGQIAGSNIHGKSDSDICGKADSDTLSKLKNDKIRNSVSLNQGAISRDGAEKIAEKDLHVSGSSATNKCQMDEALVPDKVSSQIASDCTPSSSVGKENRCGVNDCETEHNTDRERPSTTQHAALTRAKSGYTCCHCSEDAVVPLKSHCSHVCCLECWKYCIRELKKCPNCGEKVKRKHLSRIFFASGPNIVQ